MKIGHNELLHWDMWDEQASLCTEQLLGIGMLCGNWVYERLDMHDGCN